MADDDAVPGPDRTVPSGPLALLLVAVLAGGCGGDGETARGHDFLADSVYVEVMARLVLVDSTFGDGAPALPSGTPPESARARVLEEWDVQGTELLEFAREKGGEPEEMQAIWSRIHELSDSLREAGWSPASPAAPVGDTAPDAQAPSGSGGDTAEPASDGPGDDGGPSRSDGGP